MLKQQQTQPDISVTDSDMPFYMTEILEQFDSYLALAAPEDLQAATTLLAGASHATVCLHASLLNRPPCPAQALPGPGSTALY